MNKIGICNFSGGWCSFWAALRMIQKHGPLNSVLLFADTLVEDDSLYLFLEQSSKYLGVPITRISKEITPWQLFESEGMIGNDRFPICSTKLKREPLNEWMEGNFEMDAAQSNALFEKASVYMGFDWEESHRTEAMRREHPTWDIHSPMQDEPIWDKCKMEKEGKALGITSPKLYDLGFPHNNCGGRCVRAGISHWIHLLKTLPNKFKEWEDEEQRVAAELTNRGIAPLAMLKQTKDKITRPLYLKDLRTRHETGEVFGKYEWGGCGCGGSTK